MANKNQGELLFEEYLAAIGVGAEYEPVIGKRHPDYLVHSPVGDVLCEVEDFGQGDLDRVVQEQLRRTGVWAGAVDPYTRIREKLEAAARQLREFRGRHPCVVVLHNPGSVVDLGTDIVQGAMYGDIAFVVAVDPTGRSPAVEKGSQFTPGKAKLRSQQNTTISAVAVLEHYRPNQYKLEEALAHRSKEDPPKWPTKEEIKEGLDILEKVRQQHPEVDLVVPRLRVVHNVYATIRLPVAAFPGPYDEQYELDHQTGRFRRVNPGPTKAKSEVNQR
jgi:hypothetical protein